MAIEGGKFIIDKEELKPGLILFRRSDVKHRNWYCRVKVLGFGRVGEKDDKERYKDKYKTISLKTENIQAARLLAWDHDGDVRYALKHQNPIYNRPFRDVAKEFYEKQQARMKRGEITKDRVDTIRTIINGALDEYVGSIQVHLIGDERWGSYPIWRRENGVGLVARNGSRTVSEELARKLVEAEFARRARANVTRGLRPKTYTPAQWDEAVAAKMTKPLPYVGDDTIRMEMKVFGAIMNFAVKQRYVSASVRFTQFPALKRMQREEFTAEEYRKLHTQGRAWIKKRTVLVKGKNGELVEEEKTNGPVAVWYRTMVYNLVLIACNTGMRPPEMRNLRWRDVWPAKDREGRDIYVLSVQGKGKSRKLVAPKSVGDYLDRIRELATEANRKRAGQDATRSAQSYEPQPDDPVFTTINGKSSQTLYGTLIENLLDATGLRKGADGTMRTTYCFRHTYATFRLQKGVDVYFLAEQMGTSVKMIETHYGHVNTIRHADRVLMGMEGWEPISVDPETLAGTASGQSNAKGAQAAKTKQPAKPTSSKR